MPLFLHPMKDLTFLILCLSPHLCEEQCLPALRLRQWQRETKTRIFALVAWVQRSPPA